MAKYIDVTDEEVIENYRIAFLPEEVKDGVGTIYSLPLSRVKRILDKMEKMKNDEHDDD